MLLRHCCWCWRGFSRLKRKQWSNVTQCMRVVCIQLRMTSDTVHDFCICHHRSRLMLQVSHLQCQCLAPPATIYTFWPADVRWWINHHHTYSCTTNMLFLLVPLSVAVACCTGRRRLWLTKCSGFLIPLHVLSRTLGIMIDLHHAMIHDLHWPGHDRPHSVPDCSYRVSCLHDHAPDYVSELCACPASYTSSSYS